MSNCSAAQPVKSSPRTNRKTGRIALLLALIVVLMLWPVGREHLRAMSLLARMTQQKSWIAQLDRHAYDVKPLSFPVEGGTMHAKLYVPRDTEHPPAMVVVHGLHHLGMEEPRLVLFAKSLAETGVEVMTPQVDAIADYRVEPQSIDLIGRSAQQLASLSSSKPVGVLGLSFAGGLALMAAADPKYADQIYFVAAVGAQDSVLRVERYLVEGVTRWPDGKALDTPPHEYGWLILIYSHSEDFFSAADAEQARKALRLLLHQDLEGAKREAQLLSPTGRQRMKAIFERQREGFRGELLSELNRYAREAAAASPAGHLPGLKAKVLLVHGEGDDVIPPSETEWLVHDIPPGHLQAALISRAISHVNLEKQPNWRDQLALVHWIALMLADADRERGASTN